MSFDWNKIGEKISSLYGEMEYHPDYDIEKFESDLENQLKKENVSIRAYPITESDNSTESNRAAVLHLRDIIESRRSILTKLFSITNNPNGVDILIEYCDFYKSCYEEDILRTNISAGRSPTAQWLIYSVFTMLAKSDITEKVIEHVWRTIHIGSKLHKTLSKKGNLNSPPPRSFAMVIMADSDLNAAVQALARSRHTYFEVSRVLVQEPIKEQLLRTIKNYGYNIGTLFNLFVFHNTAEALGNLNGKDKFNALSVWSENIIAVKKFSASVKVETVWINAHGALGAGLNWMVYNDTYLTNHQLLWSTEGTENSEDAPQTFMKISKTYDHYYGGKWHSPANGEYWTNQSGDSFAEATDKDFGNCARAARGAVKTWRSKTLSQRAKIIRSFAERLRANGDYKWADVVLQVVDHPLKYGASVSIVRDGEAEIITTLEPVGVVAFTSKDFELLFAKLIIACVTGNAVIVVLNSRSSVSLAPYCDLMATCGFPPGIVNCLFTSSLLPYKVDVKLVDAVIPELGRCIFSKTEEFIADKARENILYHEFFTTVTKPKFIWLQCD